MCIRQAGAGDLRMELGRRLRSYIVPPSRIRLCYSCMTLNLDGVAADWAPSRKRLAGTQGHKLTQGAILHEKGDCEKSRTAIIATIDKAYRCLHYWPPSDAEGRSSVLNMWSKNQKELSFVNQYLRVLSPDSALILNRNLTVLFGNRIPCSRPLQTPSGIVIGLTFRPISTVASTSGDLR